MRLHIGVKVLPYQRRDFFRSLPEAVQHSWDPVSGEQATVGEETQYTLDFPSEEMARDVARRMEREAGNVRYAVPEREEHAMGWKTPALGGTGEVLLVAADEYESTGGATPVTGPTHDYIGLTGLVGEGYDGKGTLVVGADTGMSRIVAEKLGSRFVAGRNFSGERGPDDTSDNHGHGSGSGYMATPPRGSYTPAKVLKDNGGGGSSGIVKSFLWATELARANPERAVIYNGSFGGRATDSLFQPYLDAIAEATAAGVVFVFSAGNDNAYGLGSPSVICRVNDRVLSSIAFDKKTDAKAPFSNFHETGSISAPGVDEPGYDEHGAVVLWDGTSFSAPNTTKVLACLATPKKWPEEDAASVLAKVAEAAKKNGRDSSAPVQEEGGGVIDAARALAKLRPSAPVESEYWYLRRKTWEANLPCVLTDAKGRRLARATRLED